MLAQSGSWQVCSSGSTVWGSKQITLALCWLVLCETGVQYPFEITLCAGQSYCCLLSSALAACVDRHTGRFCRLSSVESVDISLKGVAYSGSGGRGWAYSGSCPGVSQWLREKGTVQPSSSGGRNVSPIICPPATTSGSA